MSDDAFMAIVMSIAHPRISVHLRYELESGRPASSRLRIVVIEDRLSGSHGVAYVDRGVRNAKRLLDRLCEYTVPYSRPAQPQPLLLSPPVVVVPRLVSSPLPEPASWLAPPPVAADPALRRQILRQPTKPRE